MSCFPDMTSNPQDELMPRYAELVYNGFWFSPERRAMQAAIDETQQFCSGTVRVKLYKVCPLSLSPMLLSTATKCFSINVGQPAAWGMPSTWWCQWLLSY